MATSCDFANKCNNSVSETNDSTSLVSTIPRWTQEFFFLTVLPFECVSWKMTEIGARVTWWPLKDWYLFVSALVIVTWRRLYSWDWSIPTLLSCSCWIRLCHVVRIGTWVLLIHGNSVSAIMTRELASAPKHRISATVPLSVGAGWCLSMPFLWRAVRPGALPFLYLCAMWCRWCRVEFGGAARRLGL